MVVDANGNYTWDGSDTDVFTRWGLPCDRPVVGDWNGDGKSDIGIFRPSSGIWNPDSNGNHVWEGSDTSVSWGYLGIYRLLAIGMAMAKSISAFSGRVMVSGVLTRMGTLSGKVLIRVLSWGLPNDTPVVGDWNGDGKGGYRHLFSSNSIWSLDSDGNSVWEGSDTSVSWGLPNDTPVVGDWNGDGKVDIGIF